jgi:hypothetical protein
MANSPRAAPAARAEPLLSQLRKQELWVGCRRRPTAVHDPLFLRARREYGRTASQVPAKGEDTADPPAAMATVKSEDGDDEDLVRRQQACGRPHGPDTEESLTRSMCRPATGGLVAPESTHGWAVRTGHGSYIWSRLGIRRGGCLRSKRDACWQCGTLAMHSSQRSGRTVPFGGTPQATYYIRNTHWIMQTILSSQQVRWPAWGTGLPGEPTRFLTSIEADSRSLYAHPVL